jgi:hypothetical protein
MRTPAKSVALLLLLLLAGCVHKNDQAKNRPLAPPIVDKPTNPPTPTPTELPASAATVPQAPTTQIPPLSQPEQKPVKKAHHPKPDSKTTEQAANAAPVEVSAIGQLSPAGSSDLKQQTEESIASTENGLKDINRSLNDQEQKTVAQIREFLKQARTALGSGDVDGAHTLAVKAKVLFGEISQ